MTTKSFNICIFGTRAVGKSTFLHRHKTGQFRTEYLPTIGHEIVQLNFNTNKGKVTLNCWDCGTNFGSEVYEKADAHILMFSRNSRESYAYITKFYEEKLFQQCCPDTPVVVCGNKIDLPSLEVRPQQITFHRDNGLVYFDTSAKSNYNFEKPFLYILERLMDRNTYFVEEEDKQVDLLAECEKALQGNSELDFTTTWNSVVSDAHFKVPPDLTTEDIYKYLLDRVLSYNGKKTEEFRLIAATVGRILNSAMEDVLV